MTSIINEKYNTELSHINTIFDGDTYIRDLWLKYGFPFNGKFIELNSNINLYEACFIGLCVKTYIDTYTNNKSSINVLEIGLAYATSSIHIINRLLKYGGNVNYTVIDPNQSSTWESIGINHIRQYLRDNNSNSIHLNLIEKYSQDAMSELKDKFDIIFIDGSHAEDIVIQDLMNSDKILKPNGIIIVDDVKHSGVKNALAKFTKLKHSSYKRITIEPAALGSSPQFKKLPMANLFSKDKKDIYNPNTMFCYQRIGDKNEGKIENTNIIQSSQSSRTIRSFKEAVAIAEKYIGGEDSTNNSAIIPPYYSPPPETNLNIWEMSLPALKNTLEYIMNYLNHSCYMLCVKNNRGVLYKLEQHTTAEVYKPFIRSSIEKLKTNPTLNQKNRDFIKKTLVGKELRFMQCVVKQYFAGKDTFADEYVDFIDGLLLNNGVYIMNLTDSVILREDGNHPFPMVVGKLDIGKYKKEKFIPIFSLSGQKGYSDIPIPNYDDVLYVLGKSSVKYESFETDWEKKKTKAVFRGGPTGCGYTPDTNSRLKLTTIRSKYLDIGISGKAPLINTNSVRYDPKYGIGMLNTDIHSTQKFMTMTEQSHNKYIIHIDGNVHAYRMLTTMATGSLILRVESEYTSWLDHILKPNVHYIPVKSDLSDLVEKIEWCIKNDDKCKTIAENACKIARDVVQYDKLRAIFQNIMETVSAKTTKRINHPISDKIESMPLDIRVKKTKRCPNGRHRVRKTAKCRLTGKYGTLSSPHIGINSIQHRRNTKKNVNNGLYGSTIRLNIK